jgi:hypothetical protein
MTNIETGVSTLKGLAEWILKQGIELQMREIRTFDDNLIADGPWHGVIKDYEDYVVLSDELTQEQFKALARNKLRAEQVHREWLESAPDREAERYRSQRAEVREAQEKGLLP